MAHSMADNASLEKASENLLLCFFLPKMLGWVVSKSPFPSAQSVEKVNLPNLMLVAPFTAPASSFAPNFSRVR